jgi:hypothetical protein
LLVAHTLPAESMRFEVETEALAADLASLLRRCGYEDVEVGGRFVNALRIDPGQPLLEEIRLAGLVDVWRRRHGGAIASRKR